MARERQCLGEKLIEAETEAIKEFIDNGWSLYNEVLTTDTTILNAPRKYITCLKGIIRDLDTGVYSEDSLLQTIKELQKSRMDSSPSTNP